MLGLLCATAFAACLIWFAFAAARGLRRNLKAAQESGLNYLIARKSAGAVASFNLVLSFHTA